MNPIRNLKRHSNLFKVVGNNEESVDIMPDSLKVSNRVKTILKTYRMFTFIFALTFIAFMYVNQQVLIYQMGLKVKENQQIYSKLVDRNRILVYNVLNQKSPVNLETKLLAKNVELNMPRKWQVVKLEDSPAKFVRNDVAKRGLFASLFIMGREAEASPNKNDYSD